MVFIKVLVAGKSHSLQNSSYKVTVIFTLEDAFARDFNHIAVCGQSTRGDSNDKCCSELDHRMSCPRNRRLLFQSAR